MTDPVLWLVKIEKFLKAGTVSVSSMIFNMVSCPCAVMCEAPKFGDCIDLSFYLGSVTLNKSLGLPGPYSVRCKTYLITLRVVKVKKEMYVKSALS